MNRNIFFLIFFFLLVWKIILYFSLSLGIQTMPLKNNFLGGGMNAYLEAPYFWSWANFDGEHYLSLAQNWYRPLEHFFFPGYPSMIRLIANFLSSNSNFQFAAIGLFISHVAFLLALIGIWRLVVLDYSKRVAITTILFLLLFPTSFYFAALYTEALFLCLLVWSVFFVRTGNWHMAGILGFLLSTTRLVGIVLIPYFLLEAFLQYKKTSTISFQTIVMPLLASLMSISGLLTYMWFLYNTTGDPIAFFNNVSLFGDQRSSQLIILPQVFYRYIFKVLPIISISYFSGFFSVWLEFLVALFFFIGSIVVFFKLRLSYGVLSFLLFFVPTLSGSFSSMSRYALVIFPVFILFGRFMEKQKAVVRIGVFLLLTILLSYATILFTRGYWIA